MKMLMKDRGFWVGTAYCVLAALAWAIIGPISRICFAEGMEPASVAFWRMAISRFSRSDCGLSPSRIFSLSSRSRRTAWAMVQP